MKADKDNDYMRQHQKNMRDFDKSFNEAEKDAYVRSATDAGKSKKIALIAVAAALFIIGFIGAFMVEPLKQSATKASISNNSSRLMMLYIRILKMAIIRRCLITVIL